MHYIKRIQNLVDADDLEELESLKRWIKDIENKGEQIAAQRFMAKYNVEGKKSTCFFCKLNKKMKSITQFDTLVVK